jgi:hypothetical protein
MLFRRFLFALTAVFALTAATALAQTTTSSSSTVTRSLTYPPIGLASSETAQINVANLATASSSGTAASCTGTVSFVSASGAAIGTASSFTLTSGQISSVSLPYSKVGGSGRTEIRGVIALTETPGSGIPCDLVSSLETYDTGTGVTHVFLSGPGGAYGGQGPGPGFGAGPGR